MFSLTELTAASTVVYSALRPTPTLGWPLLDGLTGARVSVKHENHLPTGAFKVRGGVHYLDRLVHSDRVPGIISATRGNHGQSLAYAAGRHRLRAVIAVPHGNSAEKNAAMAALGAELVETGHDFQAAREWAEETARREGLHLVPSWHPWLVQGVASGSLEFLRDAPDLETIYVPIGMGSGICAMIAARDALGSGAEIVGVVSEGAPAHALSFAARKVVPTERADTIADGVATRQPDPTALAMIVAGVDRIVQLNEAAIGAAMRHYFRATHQVVEGAGALPLAALMKERERMVGRRVGLVLSGGNVDLPLFAAILNEAETAGAGSPAPAPPAISVSRA